MMSPKAFWALLKEAGSQWWKDNAPHLGAALAFYATFSLAPLLLITVAITGFVFGREAAEGRLLAQLRQLVGEEMGAALQATIASANEPRAGILAAVVGAAMLLLGAAWLFGELHDALNTIWKVQPQPGNRVWRFAKYHFLSFAMVVGTASVLLISLVVSAALAGLGSQLGDWQSFRRGEAINFVVSFGVTTVLFAMIYRFLPDTVVAWKHVWIGSVVTSLLFSIGKLLIGLYLGHTAVASAFGAAGSLAALLIWLYYSAQIFLFGAELTKAYATRRRSHIVLDPSATPVAERG
jgi:membrane protein